MTVQTPQPNATQPQWKQLVLRLANNREAIGEFSDDELDALFQKAVKTMQPKQQELEDMLQDKEARKEYASTFAMYYKSGLPPWSGVSETIITE